MIKRLIKKLKTSRNIFKPTNNPFYENLMEDWGKDGIYGPWIKYKKGNKPTGNKPTFYKKYYLLSYNGSPNIESISDNFNSDNFNSDNLASN